MSPKFSVVIPAYNQAEYITATIQSVLDQTLQDFEVIVVNDASPDNTQEVVTSIRDARIQILVHPQNKGLPAARNTGMRAARGEYIALLDSDDLFHPAKLQAHASFLDQHPEIAVTYNSRFELNYSDTTIRDLVRPPLQVGLRDFLYGYPFTPSDMVIRKEVVDSVGVFDEFYRNGGEDMEYPATLALAGCRFASVDKALNYRRHHSGRYRKNLDARLKDVQIALAKIQADPRCPPDLCSLGEIPLSEHYIVLVYLAFIQNRTEDGRRFLLNLTRINPKVLEGTPCQVSEYFLNNSCADESEDHAANLRCLFGQLPPLPVDISGHLDWAVKTGYLIKGVRAALWDRPEAAEQYFYKAMEIGATFTRSHLRRIAHQLVNFEAEMSLEATQAALRRLLPQVKKLCPAGEYRSFLGELNARRAFENFQRQQFSRVPGNVIRALSHDPALLRNRGMYALLARSLFKK